MQKKCLFNKLVLACKDEILNTTKPTPTVVVFFYLKSFFLDQ